MAKVNINGAGDYLSPVGVSKLGTLIFDNILFPAFSWTDINGEKQSYEEFRLDSVNFRVSRRKDIVKTKRAGGDGTFKEYICFDDFQIDVNAILAPNSYNPTEQEPIAELNVFAKLEKAQSTVPVRSKILQNTFNITNVVLEDFSMERQGSDSWKLNMLLISDLPINFESFG
jgi:hypothetical protein